MSLPMKFHIDRLYEYLSDNDEKLDYELGQLLGSLYAIGSQWEHYKVFFESQEEQQ